MSSSTGMILDEARALLARTPGVLDAWLRDLSGTWVHSDEGPDTWGPLASSWPRGWFTT